MHAVAAAAEDEEALKMRKMRPDPQLGATTPPRSGSSAGSRGARSREQCALPGEERRSEPLEKRTGAAMRLLLLSWLLLLLVAGRCSAPQFLRGSEAQQGVQGAQQGFHGARLGVPGAQQGFQGVSDGRSALQLGRGSRTRAEDGGALSRARSPQGPEGNPRDPRQKERFLKHLTGPLHFTQSAENISTDCTTTPETARYLPIINDVPVC
ncbi:hypothetical protein NQZ68_039332 [Dissostichus eleginoides]|nr:hypothetical protein NQZ68_039332 [Dissostichus eleginoides]